MTALRENQVDLSLVVPCYNEAARLTRTLPGALDYLHERGVSFEVIVDDDGSQDATQQAAEAFADRGVRTAKLERNSGKGAACPLPISSPPASRST